ncbi:MAG: Crp/Fnr family transcriptional regulator [Candidatus Eremiobacterota bacterium]
MVEILRKVPLFAGLSEEDLRALTSIVHRKRQSRGTVVFQQGDPGDEFLVLIEGSVKVELMNAEGKELTLTILQPFQFLGELALLDDVPRSATVVAMENATFFVIHKADFYRMLESYPRMGLPIIRQLTRRLRILTDDIASLAFMDAYTRVARKILALADEMGQRNDQGHVLIDQPLTHQEFANLVGTTRETVTKILNEMKDHELISIARHRICILDPRELADRANLPSFCV